MAGCPEVHNPGVWPYVAVCVQPPGPHSWHEDAKGRGWSRDPQPTEGAAVTGKPTLNTVKSEEGHVFEPWTDGWAVGFKVTHAVTGDVRYVYLNPSSDDDPTGDANVFLYTGPAGDSPTDQPVIYVNPFDKEERTPTIPTPDELATRMNTLYAAHREDLDRLTALEKLWVDEILPLHPTNPPAARALWDEAASIAHARDLERQPTPPTPKEQP
jgi:hypothetical protein